MIDKTTGRDIVLSISCPNAPKCGYSIADHDIVFTGHGVIDIRCPG